MALTLPINVLQTPYFYYQQVIRKNACFHYEMGSVFNASLFYNGHGYFLGFAPAEFNIDRIHPSVPENLSIDAKFC